MPIILAFYWTKNHYKSINENKIHKNRWEQIEKHNRKSYDNFGPLLFQTYVGDILIAVNPFKDLGIYGKEVSIKLMHMVQ